MSFDEEKVPICTASSMITTNTSDSSSPVCIFLTGATGFLGKVVLEELLRRRGEYHLTKIYLLLRSKHKYDAQSRFLHKIASSPCFLGLAEGWMNTIEVIEGDACLPKCGMETSTYDRISQEITHVIHCAGCISFELPILEAIEANIDGTLNVYDLAKACSKLIQFVTTSTAYVTPHTDLPIHESLPQLPYSAQEILRGICVGRWSEGQILSLTGHPNTYTLTKCLSEHLIMERQDIPLTIIRPSIISASLRYPMPGWIDSSAAFAGFVSAIGSGVLHVVDGDPDVSLDIVPVDLVAERIIDETLFSPSLEITAHPDSNQAPPPRIIHAVATLKHSLPISAILQTVIDFFRHKSGKSLGRHYVGPRDLKYHLLNFTDHTVPLALAQGYFWLRGNEKMYKVIGNTSSLVQTLGRVFPYFTNRTFGFEAAGGGLFSRALRVVEKGGGEVEKWEEVEWDGLQYIRLVCMGVDKHLLSRARKY